MTSPGRLWTCVEPREWSAAEHGEAWATGTWQATVGGEDPPAGDDGQPPPRRRLMSTAASRGQPRRPKAEGRPVLGLKGDLDGEGHMVAESDAQGQQPVRERRRVFPVARADVAHGPRRDAGRDRDLVHRRPPDSGRDDPPDRVDPVEAAMQDSYGKLTACPPASPTAQPRDTNQTTLRPLAHLPPVVAPPDQPATARPAASSWRPDRLLHVGGMMPPGTRAYQRVADVARMPSPISVAITSRFMPIEGCRQHLVDRSPGPDSDPGAAGLGSLR